MGKIFSKQTAPPPTLPPAKRQKTSYSKLSPVPTAIVQTDLWKKP